MAKKEEEKTFDVLSMLIDQQFEDVVDLSKVDTKVKSWYDTGVYALNYTMSKNLKAGVPGGRITSFDGLKGCLYDETIIKVKRGTRKGYKKYTIKELFQKFHLDPISRGSKPFKTFSYKEYEDLIASNEIEDVYDSGEKECFEVETVTGKKIIASSIHPFKVLPGTENSRGVKEKDNYVPLEKLTVEDCVMVKSPRGFNPFNWTKKTSYEKIKSITSVGMKHTYDIKMKTPYSNFVANDFVVHNSGKSLMCSSTMRDPNLDMVIILETEGGGHAQELIEFAGVDLNKVRIVQAHTFGNYKIKKSNGDIEEVSDDKFPQKKDTDQFLYKEGAIRKIKKFIQALEFNPKLQEARIAIVLDSLGNLQSVREFKGTPDMGARSIDIGRFFRTFDNAFQKTEIAFIFTNKLYTNIGNVFDPWKASGGVNVEYNPSVSVRLAEISATDDVTDADMKKEKERRKSSLGNSLKTIRANITKSRFGTEGRNCWFLLDSVSGPVRLSGLFTLLKDSGIIKQNGSRYLIDGWNLDNSFYKKDFINLVIQEEEKNINFFQEKLDDFEKRNKEEKLTLQVNDINEVQEETDGDYDLGDMVMAMERDKD